MISDAVIAEIAALATHVEDEDTVRRRQIGVAMRHVNAALSAAGDTRRFFAFDDNLIGWETDEPVWVLLTSAERATLLTDAVVRVPKGIEREYDPTDA